MLLRVRQAGVKFGSRWIFRKINFELECGNRLLVLGHNGTGKSTLLKSLVRLIPLSEGHIESTVPVGYAALDMNLYPALNAREHLKIAAKLRGVPDRTDELLSLLELKKEECVAYYSSGMKMRLKLALAIQPYPKILILDEPSSALDKAGCQILEQIIDSQSLHGIVVLATNNDQDKRYATHELTLDD